MPAPVAPSARRLPAWSLVGVISGLVLACYWPVLQGGLVWDDSAHVTRPELRSAAGLVRIWTELHATQQYYPVLHSAFWLEHRLWGDATLGYHLVNVLFHVLSCCLLVPLLRRLRPADGRGPPEGTAWLVALLFAVHPVCVESVAWISEQKNTLSLVFSLLAALAYLDFEADRRPWAYGRALAFFLLALGTKSVTATLPGALLVLLWWRNGRLPWRTVGPLLPWLAVGAAAGLFTAWIERRLIGAQGAAFDLPAADRLLLAGRVVWFYLGKLSWPADLMFVYPRWDVAAMGTAWWGGVGAALAVTAALWSIRRRWRGPLAAWLYFVGSLFPVLGFFSVYPFLFSYVADHFQYEACLGILTAAAAGLAFLARRLPPRARAGGWILAGFLVAGLAFLSNRQCRIFRDAPTLYRATLTKNPACWMAHNNLAVELMKRPGHESEALAHYEAALRLKPDYAEAHNNYANALAALPGRGREALAHYETALRLQPDFADAHVNLANVLATVPGRLPEAVAHYERALEIDPGVAEVHYDLANALAQMPGRLPDALAQYGQALRLNPALAEAHVNLANVLATVPGRLSEALGEYERALQLDPGMARAHYDLAVQLSKLPGREAEAIEQYEAALRLKPDYAKAHNNLGIAYAREGRLEEARIHWERALELDPSYDDARRNLRRLQQMKGP